MLAIAIDSILFLLLVGIAALLRLLASKVGDTKSEPEEPEEHPTARPPPVTVTRRIEHAAEETDADRIRKFLEALGQPLRQNRRHRSHHVRHRHQSPTLFASRLNRRSRRDRDESSSVPCHL